MQVLRRLGAKPPPQKKKALLQTPLMMLTRDKKPFWLSQLLREVVANIPLLYCRVFAMQHRVGRSGGRLAKV